jgi:hypothetical protein
MICTSVTHHQQPAAIAIRSVIYLKLHPNLQALLKGTELFHLPAAGISTLTSSTTGAFQYPRILCHFFGFTVSSKSTGKPEPPKGLHLRLHPAAPSSRIPSVFLPPLPLPVAQTCPQLSTEIGHTNLVNLSF